MRFSTHGTEIAGIRYVESVDISLIFKFPQIKYIYIYISFSVQHDGYEKYPELYFEIFRMLIIRASLY